METNNNNRIFDEDGFEVLPEDSYYDQYSLDTNRGSKKNSYSIVRTKQGIEEGLRKVRDEYNDSYGNYEKTGIWKGYNYYKKQLLTYKYIQQMANILSAKHNVKIKVGNHWEVNKIEKSLTYNPSSLIYGSKTELIAILIHEIGNIRYTEPIESLSNKYLIVYKEIIENLFNVYDNYRADSLMLKEYTGATDIFKSLGSTIKEKLKIINECSDKIVGNERDIVSNLFDDFHLKYGGDFSESYYKWDSLNDEEKLEVEKDEEVRRTKFFGISNKKEIIDKLTNIESKIEFEPNIFDFISLVLKKMYSVGRLDSEKTGLMEIFKETEGAINLSKLKKNSQELINYLDIEVFPKVEKLLKNSSGDNFKKEFPNIDELEIKNIYNESESRKKNLSQKLKNSLKNNNGYDRGDNTPREWFNGDYEPLRDSVLMEIKELERKLTFLKREDETRSFQQDQRRGKLNTRKLYKSVTGSRRLFKQKIDKIEKIKSFAFSLLLDTSGSMNGSRIAHSVRAIIIMAEVFKKIDIPFELVLFSNSADVLKSFDDSLDKSMKKKIAGLTNNSGGGTELDSGLKGISIHKREEKNKVVVIVTDGNVSNISRYDEKYFSPWAKKGILSLAFGLNCNKGIEDLCLGNGIALDDPNGFPPAFGTKLKEIIK